MNPFKITYTSQNLKALLTISDADPYPDAQEIEQFLRSQKIAFGIKPDVIKKISKEKRPVYEIVVAEGQPPEQGSDSRWESALETDLSQKPEITSSNRADFKQIHSFEHVKADQKIAVKIPAQKGKPGRDVFGNEIILKGDDTPAPQGRNTYLSEDGMTLLAGKNGFVTYEDNLFHVDEVYFVKGDISYSTGNVKFNGPVVIEGDVRSGFRVEATGSIYVGGNIEAASVYSQNGNITVQYGIVGKGKAKVLAGGNLKCAFIQDATVGVRKNIEVSHYIIGSTVSAGGTIVLNENEGLIRGGSIVAEKGIFVRNVGSERKVETELKIRSYAESPTHSRLWKLSKERAHIILRISSLSKRLSFLELLSQKLKDLSEEKKEERLFLKKELTRLNQKLDELDIEEIELQKEASKETINKEIRIEEILYPNVLIDIGGQEFISDKTMSSVKFYYFKNELIVESLKNDAGEKYQIFLSSEKRES